jgi:hypothetical protein
MALPLWLNDKLWMGDDVASRLDGFTGDLLFGEHHESHAASAFYPSQRRRTSGGNRRIPWLLRPRRCHKHSSVLSRRPHAAERRLPSASPDRARARDRQCDEAWLLTALHIAGLQAIN